MTAQELVQFIYDFDNIPASEFRSKYPDLIARRDAINTSDSNARAATMNLIVELAAAIIEEAE